MFGLSVHFAEKKKKNSVCLKKSTIRARFEALTMCIVAPESSLLDCTCSSVETLGSKLQKYVAVRIESFFFYRGDKYKLLKLKDNLHKSGDRQRLTAMLRQVFTKLTTGRP